MMRTTLMALLGASPALAAYLINELSFGYNGVISPNHDGHIPNFHLQGNPNLPEVLSNKIVLTPVAPGNQRGAVWSDNKLTQTDWVTDVDFRASGPERGGGNLNIWLVNGGGQLLGSSSIYTVGKFEGLAVVIDTYAGSGGMVRGFLNDGTMDYSHLHNIDDHSFGHCLYSYRNLGRPSQLKIQHSSHGLRVDIDGHLCFESEKISIPNNYQFGITAATPDNPDSFEVYKLMAMSQQLHEDHSFAQQNVHVGEEHGHHDGHHEEHHDEHFSHDQKPMPGQPPHVVYGRGGFRTSDQYDPPVVDDPYDSEIPDEKADHFTSSRAQFEDLHNRLQSINHHLSSVFKQASRFHVENEHRHAEVSQLIDKVREEVRRFDLSDMQRKLENLERDVRGLRAELSGQVRNTEHAIKGFMTDHHTTLSNNISKHSTGHGRLIFVIIGSQVLLVLGYIVYKRRKNASPKKYL